jgi:outer membrane lipoprotein SlyB
MKITHRLIASIVAISALMPMALLPIQASAQQYNNNNSANATPHIDGFSVDEVRRLIPGTELKFAIYGTPGGLATLRIAGTTRNLPLFEVETGQYEGSYTINRNDKIVARSPVTANLRVGNQVTSAILNESLQVGVGYHDNRSIPGQGPKIERFGVNAINELSPGNELNFTMSGTPDGKADIAIAGVKGKLFMQEGNAGEYATTYTIRTRDRIKANSAVTAKLRVGDRVTSARLNQNLQNAAAPAPVAAHVCRNCGTVEAVNLIEIRGDGSYLGSIGGGVVGALLGNQIGSGNGRTAATIAGAVGGVYAGRAIEGNSRRAHHYEVLVRFDNGASQTLSFATAPDYRVGDKVKVNNGVLSHNK